MLDKDNYLEGKRKESFGWYEMAQAPCTKARTVDIREEAFVHRNRPLLLIVSHLGTHPRNSSVCDTRVK